MRRAALWGMAVALAVGPALLAQQAGGGEAPDDGAGLPSEYGIRLTPTMARGIGRQLARQMFVRQHELDETKLDDAAELIARRIMQFAHQNEAVCQDLLEFAVTETTGQQARRRQDMGPPDPAFFQGIGKRLLPIMPSIRELTNGILQDVRPMLAFKEQLKLTGEIAAMNVALDAFEKNMGNWSNGEVDLSHNPFEDQEQSQQKDEKGETKAMKEARQAAEANSNETPGDGWEDYVEKAKKYYQLDASQAAAADSLLREYQGRAKTVVGNPAEWKARIHRNRLMWWLSGRLQGGWGRNPIQFLLEHDFENMRKPVEALRNEMKQQIEAIPTQAQRDAAEVRAMNLFAEKGLQMEAITAVTTAPADEVSE